MLSPSQHLFVQRSNRNTRKSCEICSKSTIKTTEQRQNMKLHLQDYFSGQHLLKKYLRKIFIISAQ